MGSVPTTLRLLTYNIHQLRDDADAIRDVLIASRADVVAVQEPPRGPRGAARLRRLSWSAGYQVAVVGGGARTTALLVRTGLPFTGARGVRLAWRPGRTRRGLAVADVAGVRVISTHLSLVPAERVRHLIRLLLVVRSTVGPCVVAGDLNEDPGGPSWQRLALHLHDVTTSVGPTFPARGPQRRIDAILVSHGTTATDARVLDEPGVERASDHRPVVADLHLR
jgi:endonuclease/exonuclease/phosphatase family metal-dependent hydrolase